MGQQMRRMIGGMFGMFIALAAALVLMGGGVAAAGLNKDTTLGSGSGGSYVSPTYGYTVGWTTPWTETQQNTDAQGRDFLQLQDGVGVVVVAGTATTQTDARQCLVAEAQADAAMSGVSNFAVLKDPSTGMPVAQGDAADAAAIFTFTMTAQDGTTQSMAMLLDCRIAHQTEILLTAVAPTDQFAQEATAFEAIDRGIVLNADSGQSISTAGGA